MIILTNDQEAQIRATAGDLNIADAQEFRARVIDRLEKFLDGGSVHAISTSHVLAACNVEQMSEA